MGTVTVVTVVGFYRRMREGRRGHLDFIIVTGTTNLSRSYSLLESYFTVGIRKGMAYLTIATRERGMGIISHDAFRVR